MSQRYYYALLEEPSNALVRTRTRRQRFYSPYPRTPPRPRRGELDPLAALLDALGAASRCCDGDEAWVAPYIEHPLAFVLDTLSDGIVVWTGNGRIVFANRAARSMELDPPSAATFQELTVGEKCLSRRAIRYERGGETFVVEVISETPKKRSAR